MSRQTIGYRGYRFPSEIIGHAVWLYHRFFLSLRDVEEMLAERGIEVTYETVRQWCRKFGPRYARTLKRRGGSAGDVWYLDEVFVKIGGKIHYLWRAVDQDGEVIDILLQKRRHKRAAARFFRKLLRGEEMTPTKLVTDKLGSYAAARADVMPSVPHCTARYANNRAEVASTHETARTSDVTFQVPRPGATIPSRAQPYHQPLCHGAPSSEREELSVATRRSVRDMARNHRPGSLNLPRLGRSSFHHHQVDGTLRIIVRTSYHEDVERLKEAGATHVVAAEAAAADAIVERLLRNIDCTAEDQSKSSPPEEVAV